MNRTLWCPATAVSILIKNWTTSFTAISEIASEILSREQSDNRSGGSYLAKAETRHHCSTCLDCNFHKAKPILEVYNLPSSGSSVRYLLQQYPYAQAWCRCCSWLSENFTQIENYSMHVYYHLNYKLTNFDPFDRRYISVQWSDASHMPVTSKQPAAI